MYSIKETFYTLQGEGLHTGRPAVFCRFSGCNLWSGLEKHRLTASCSFCDTNFIGTDGSGGGKFTTANLANHIASFWPNSTLSPFVVMTGGEPLLQLDKPLIDELHQMNFEIAVETNGTQSVPEGIDWLTVSPKHHQNIIIKQCNELKLVYPQAKAMPQHFSQIKAQYYYLTPMANPHCPNHKLHYHNNITQKIIQFCLQNPRWRLNIQTHKIINIP